MPSLREKASGLSYPIAHERKMPTKRAAWVHPSKDKTRKDQWQWLLWMLGGSCFTAAICTKIWSNYNICEKLGKVTQPSMENSTSPGLNETIT